MRNKLLFLTMLILTLTACSKKPGTLSGNVFWKYNDYVGNKPDAGSFVNLYSTVNKEINYETTTDVTGNYKIEDIIPGTYYLIIQSKNTTESPKELLDNLLAYTELKNLFGFDEKKFKKEIDEINALHDEYQDILNHSNDGKYGELSIAMDKYETKESEIFEKSMKLISKFPDKFNSKFGVITGYNENSIEIIPIDIEEGKSIIENVDFGTTYD